MIGTFPMGCRESCLMAYRYGERFQSLQLPRSIEDFVRSEDPVRAMMPWSMPWIWTAWGLTQVRDIESVAHLPLPA
jgi:hypothetical protein